MNYPANRVSGAASAPRAEKWAAARSRIFGFGLVLAVLAGTVLAGFAQEPAKSGPAYQVKIEDEKAEFNQKNVGIDPVQHVQVQGQGNMMIQVRVDNQMLHLGFIQTMFAVDNQYIFPGNPPGRMLLQNGPLPKKKGKNRTGFTSIYEVNNLHITQTVEVVATKSKRNKLRRRDAAVINYLVENKGTVPHKFGLRIFMDVFVVTNDGALFAAPNRPGKILDGIELKDKDVPEYLQFLQNPNLQNPGFVGHMTFKFGKKHDMPTRVILTRLGAFRNQWDLVPMAAMGDSAMGVYWDPREIPAKARRNMTYGFGQGITPNPVGEGAYQMALGGSFEPGKLFTVMAYINDPYPGQSLTLELPPGIERVEGKEIQPVPPPDDNENALVLWKARVLRPGRYPIRIHSNTGLTHTKVVTVSKE